MSKTYDNTFLHVDETSLEQPQHEHPTPEVDDNEFDGCIIPLITFFTVPLSALYPLWWFPFIFSKIGFPIYSLYVWPFCAIAWLLSLIMAHKRLGERAFTRFIAISSLVCLVVLNVLTFYFSFPDL